MPKPVKRIFTSGLRVIAAACIGLSAFHAHAAPITLSQVPLFLSSGTRPNLLIMYDNSQSMDATMAGKLIDVSDPTTRGNVARSVLRDVINAHKNNFNFGLGSFGTSGQGLYRTYAWYLGSNSTMVPTDDCVGGISTSNGGLRCIPMPEPTPGGSYLTYMESGDDPHINDVLYTSDFGPQLYSIVSGGSYPTYRNRRSDAGSTWTSSSFSNYLTAFTFGATDAGFLPRPSEHQRMLFKSRAYGYMANITGRGVINRAVAPTTASHVSSLMTLLAPSNVSTTSEIKNSAVFTPLAGSAKTARDYYMGAYSGMASPVTESCQKNFVVMATDGNPTGRMDGSLYSLSEQAVYDPVSDTTTFRTAANDVFAQITALRTTPIGSVNQDINTYVIGLGDTVRNRASVDTLHKMANLGGTTRAYLATDRAALVDAFDDIAADIQSRTAANASVALNSGSWSVGSRLFQGRFSSSDWSGQLLAVPIDGSGAVAGPEAWDTGRLINTQDWSASRQIITYRPDLALGSRGVAFRWPANPSSPSTREISGSMISALNTSETGVVDNYGRQRLEFLRGRTSNEPRNCGTCTPSFRDRPTSVLGDIVNSAPTFVGMSTANWRDTIDSAGRFSTFADSIASREPMLYVGANDGMLHAIDATTGYERFAYMPYAIRSKLSQLTALRYNHIYTVDGSPVVAEAVVAGAWRSILVAGMGAGARGLYSLDVTRAPAATTAESSAASIVRWETSESDARIGHIWGRPVVAKMRDGRWRALVGNGVNSPAGTAQLLAVDLADGSIISIDTGIGSADTPNGLSPVTAGSTSNSGVVDVVFAGDLRGNLWKFDLSAADPASWRVAHSVSGRPAPLFSTPTSGIADQPITARPDITRHPNGNWLVVFGTGRYIATDDNNPGATQAIYGILDGASPASLSNLQVQTVSPTLAVGASSNRYRTSTHAVGRPADMLISGDNAIDQSAYAAGKRGWYMNLPDSGERVIADVALRAGRAIISSVVPATGVCASGGSGWIIDIDTITGNRAAALDTDGDGNVTTSDQLVFDGKTLNVSAVAIRGMPSGATIMRSRTTGGQRYDDKYSNTTLGDVVRVRELGAAPPSRRTAWEQIQ